MNRKIKFRAFNKENKKMYWFGLWGNRGTGNGYIGMVEWGKEPETESNYIGNVTLVDPDFCDIMQFTGITNTDTKSELYESDIIEFKANYVTQGKLSGYIIGVIVWDYDSWKIKVGENLYSISDETDEFYYKFKVLGNIYENPELLCN